VQKLFESVGEASASCQQPSSCSNVSTWTAVSATADWSASDDADSHHALAAPVSIVEKNARIIRWIYENCDT
jgi:hypothetical protein